MIRPAALAIALGASLALAGTTQAQAVAPRRVAPRHAARNYGYAAPGYGYGGSNPAFAYGPRGYNASGRNRYASRGYAPTGTMNNLNGLANMIRGNTGNGRWR